MIKFLRAEINRLIRENEELKKEIEELRFQLGVQEEVVKGLRCEWLYKTIYVYDFGLGFNIACSSIVFMALF